MRGFRLRAASQLSLLHLLRGWLTSFRGRFREFGLSLTRRSRFDCSHSRTVAIGVFRVHSHLSGTRFPPWSTGLRTFIGRAIQSLMLWPTWGFRLSWHALSLQRRSLGLFSRWFVWTSLGGRHFAADLTYRCHVYIVFLFLAAFYFWHILFLVYSSIRYACLFSMLGRGGGSWIVWVCSERSVCRMVPHILQPLYLFCPSLAEL